MLKKILFFFISLIIGVALFIGVISSVGWQEFRSSFEFFTGWQGLIILFLTLLMLFVGAWKWRIILNSQGYNLAIKEIIKLYLSGFSLSYLFPVFIGGGTGTIFRAYVLREKFFIPWRRGVASLIIEKFLEITLGLLVMLAGFMFLLSRTGFSLGYGGIILLFGLVFFIILAAFLYFKFFRSESIIGFFAKIFSKNNFVNGTAREIEQEIFDFFNLKSAVFWKVLGLALLRVVIIGVRCWVLVLFLGKFLDLPYVLSIMALYFLTLYIPVPAMLGTHELAQAFAFGALGIGAGLAPAFTLIQRGAEITMALIGLVILFKLGTDLLGIILRRKLDVLH